MKCGCTSQGELVKLEVMYMYAIGGGNLLHYCVQASIALASATVHKFQKYNFSFCFVLCILLLPLVLTSTRSRLGSTGMVPVWPGNGMVLLLLLLLLV